MNETLAQATTLVDELIGDQAEEWDRAGRLPKHVVRELGTRGLLCAQVPVDLGGLGADSHHTGEFTAHLGSRCGSLRSVLTSHGMAAWTVQRLGDRAQQRHYLTQLTSGQVGAVAFSEPDAGSDLSAIATEVRVDGGSVVLRGKKVWVTAADYADLIVVVSKYAGAAAAVVVPVNAPGVRIERVADPLGCRAAGHAAVQLDDVRLPADALLGAGTALSMLATTALTAGRLSVAWGCVGILRACLTAATRHASSRQQFGQQIAQHQLVARHIAELFVAEQTSTMACERASHCWDEGLPDLPVLAVLAKHVAAGNAARGAAAAVQVLASAGASSSHLVARAFRDAKLMEIIEGSTEICQLILAEHIMSTVK